VPVNRAVLSGVWVEAVALVAAFAIAAITTQPRFIGVRYVLLLTSLYCSAGLLAE
jgi:hypothetical protein